MARIGPVLGENPDGSGKNVIVCDDEQQARALLRAATAHAVHGGELERSAHWLLTCKVFKRMAEHMDTLQKTHAAHHSQHEIVLLAVASELADIRKLTNTQ